MPHPSDKARFSSKTRGPRTTASRRLRFGLVGAGTIAQTWARAFAACEAIEVAGVVDVRLEAARAVAGQLGAAALVHHEELLQRDVDAIVIATPPNSHPEIAIAAATAGVHVLCEKPLAIDMPSALRMVSAARSQGVVLTMASKFRFVDDVEEAKGLLLGGLIGDLLLFENSFTSRVDMRRRWNSRRAISGGGVLIDNGTHSLDLARFFLGPLSEIQVIEGPRIQELEVEESVHVSLQSAVGIPGSIDLSWSLQKPRDSYIDLYGECGQISIGWSASRYRLTSDDAWVTFGQGYDKLAAFREQLENFVGAIRGEIELRIDASDALGSVAAVESAYRSMAQRHWEPVEMEVSA